MDSLAYIKPRFLCFADCEPELLLRMGRYSCFTRMDHSTQQNQETQFSSPPESMVVCPKTRQDRKPRPQQEPALRCPRCDSIKTKFCYYNNYSLTQPRYFCKSCRRYWTRGGTLRNIPVGGGCRKNKKSSTSSPSSSSFNKSSNDQPFKLDPTMASYYDSFDFSSPFDLVSGFKNHCSSETLENRFIETYLSSRQKLQSGSELPELGKVENGGLKPESGDDEAGNLTTTSAMKTKAKAELYGEQESESKYLWEFPWLINGDGTGVDFDPAKDYERCNEICSFWTHGRLYCPSMKSFFGSP